MRVRVQLIALTFSALSVASEFSGIWRQTCTPLTYGRIDPIVARGRLPSPHAHYICGGSALDPNATTASLRQSKCTSSTTSGDNSLYWVPLLYFAWANGSFSSVPIYTAQYYFAAETPFPDDIHIVTGNPKAVRPAADPIAAAALQWNCFQRTGVTNPTPLPNTDWPMAHCTNGLQVKHLFPRCWDGVNLDSADHASHMSYTTDAVVFGHNCPASHPVRLPQLLIEAQYMINVYDSNWADALNTSWPFVWANGNEAAYGAHADFILCVQLRLADELTPVSGWDRTTFDRANQGCVSNSNTFSIQDNCGGLLTANDAATTCQVSPLLDEQVMGTIDSLAGCNKLFSTAIDEPSCPGQPQPAALSPVLQCSAANNCTPVPSSSRLTGAASRRTPLRGLFALLLGISTL